MAVYIVLSYIAQFFTFATILLFFLTKRRQEHSMVLLAIMLCASFFADSAAITVPTTVIPRFPNIVGNVYTLVEIVTIVLLYQAQLAYRSQWPFRILLIVLLGIQLYQMVIDPGIREFPSISRMALSISVMVLGLLYFFKLMKELPAANIYLLPMFWINIALFVYFAGNFFLFVTRDYLVNTLKDNLINYWAFHNVLSILKAILFLVGLWQGARKSAPTTSNP